MAIATGAANAWRFLGAVCDDAVISFRSVENQALGHGLVYNVGERLETFTNLGFVWLLCAARWCGIDLFDAATAIGFVAAVATIPAAWWLARELGLRGAAAVVALFVAASTTLMGQAGSGLETTLCALATTAGVARTLRECRAGADGRLPRHGLGVLVLAFAAVVRPDSALVLAGALVMKPWLIAPGERRRAFVTDAAVVAASLAIVAGFRAAYYGSLLPNPVAAKVGLFAGSLQVPKQGLGYLFEWLRTDFGLPVLGAALLLALAGPRGLRALAILCAGWCCYVVASGGDHMPYSRFFAPMLGVFAATIGAAWAPLFAATRPLLVAGLAFAAAIVVQPVWLSVSRGNVPQKNMAHETYRREVGDWFASEATRRRGRLVVACNPVGYVGLFAGASVRVIDMLGLCDLHIAVHGRRDPTLLAGHQVGDGPYVLEQRPDFVVLGTLTPGDVWQRRDGGELLREIRAAGVSAWEKANDQRLLLSEREMLDGGELERDFEWATVTLPSGRPFHLLRRRA